jgi:hypothetical protein
MKPSELTADLVRYELTELIERYPDRTGAFEQVRCFMDTGEEYVDPSCVYYTDEVGMPISSATHAENDTEVVFTTPVCIVGLWIESFHPEFKDNDLIRQILIRNSTIRSLDYEDEKPWNAGVQRLLVNAQDTQDRGGRTWSTIDLDVHPDNWRN